MIKKALKYLGKKILDMNGYVKPEPSLYGDSNWFASPNLWEPSVLHVLRDLCKPGTTVFDVGANLGGLTRVMSSLVGPTGKVCSFEASPRIIGHLQKNVVAQGCFNVSVYHAAICSTTNSLINIYEGTHLNDSIYMTGSESGIAHAVKTLTLDDFCFHFNMFPDIIKMDIEGAEFDALGGATRLITEKHPILILEQSPDDMRCHELLTKLGFVTFDCNNYSRIDSINDLLGRGCIRNLVFIHKSRLNEVFLPKVVFEQTATFDSSSFQKNPGQSIFSSPIFLKQGRYLFDGDFSAEGTDNSIFCGIKQGETYTFRYHAYTKLLAENYRDWMVDIPRDGEYLIAFEFQDKTFDPSLRINNFTIKKVQDVTTSPVVSVVSK